ncbi:MAG: hypothetical protein CM15mP70_18810 [Pelagibacteraceae bacterium]|nr:MAG: hypothetical protein CM15mP70_18810 [Pelagibacteraceae bacterium]
MGWKGISYSITLLKSIILIQYLQQFYTFYSKNYRKIWYWPWMRHASSMIGIDIVNTYSCVLINTSSNFGSGTSIFSHLNTSGDPFSYITSTFCHRLATNTFLFLITYLSIPSFITSPGFR